jgi:hypothetical protein
MNADQAETLEVLREVWRGQSRSAADLDDGSAKACKRMSDAGVGFDDFGGSCEEERIAAWRARLEREGKLAASGGTLREIVLGKLSSR